MQELTGTSGMLGLPAWLLSEQGRQLLDGKTAAAGSSVMGKGGSLWGLASEEGQGACFCSDLSLSALRPPVHVAELFFQTVLWSNS